MTISLSRSSKGADETDHLLHVELVQIERRSTQRLRKHVASTHKLNHTSIRNTWSSYDLSSLAISGLDSPNASTGMSLMRLGPPEWTFDAYVSVFSVGSGEPSSAHWLRHPDERHPVLRPAVYHRGQRATPIWSAWTARLLRHPRGRSL